MININVVYTLVINNYYALNFFFLFQDHKLKKQDNTRHLLLVFDEDFNFQFF